MQFYAGEIVAQRPFTFLRYGEGEWRTIHPNMRIKKHHFYSEWREPKARQRLRNTLLSYHEHVRYWPAIWHQRWYAKDGHLPKIKGWLKENGLENIPWHDGRLWRRTLENDAAYPIIRALRDQPLPIVFVGPRQIRKVQKKFTGARFIEVHYTHAYDNIGKIEKAILKIGEPAVFSFSVGGTAKIMIHNLFPKIGDESFLIDFGAFWEGLCGGRARVYQRNLDERRLRRNWTGR